jgi:hypothetical protein
MPGLVPGIHVFGAANEEDVDGRVKPGHDGEDTSWPNDPTAFCGQESDVLTPFGGREPSAKPSP